MRHAFAKEQMLRAYPHFMLGLVAAENLGARLSSRAFFACIAGYMALSYLMALAISAAGDWYLRRTDRRGR